MTDDEQYRDVVVLATDGVVLLPHTMVRTLVQDLDQKVLDLLCRDAVPHVAVPLRPGKSAGDGGGLRDLGVMFALESYQHTMKGTLVTLKAGERVRVRSVDLEDGVLRADVEPSPDARDLGADEERQMLEFLKSTLREASSRFQGSEWYLSQMDGLETVDAMIAWMGGYMPVSAEEKYSYLETDSAKERSLRFMDWVMKTKEKMAWNIEVGERMSDKTNKFYREQMLREQMEAIRKELGQDSDGKADGYRERIEKAGMPEEVRKAALEEVSKLENEGRQGPDTAVIQNYLDFMLALPWKREPAEDVDLKAAEAVLDADHYGLEKVKRRILQHLAVMQLRKRSEGSILLFVGPPGTGKTSLGKSIAKALGRRYVRISLGGVRDESEIRGHRRTYVGALPGRILGGMKKAGTTDPVMVLDEVDKLMQGGFAGDPAAALLEVLDPEQNSTFTDHYLDLPYDLSDVFFIATANSLEGIPAPLLDRMEVIQISSYTEEEKLHIAREHLLPQALEEAGLTEKDVAVGDDVISTVISDYTREGGVRGLKKALLQIARSVSADIVRDGSRGEPRTIKAEDLDEILGFRGIPREVAGRDNPPGVVTGLAWTPVGGEILFIESATMPGKGNVILTGQLGDVMKESARISLSLVESRFPLDSARLSERDVHIHVPSGSVRKDGPSAGIAMFTSLASLFTGRKVDPHLAMTGEVSLRGAVMPIGGLKEKLIAAHKAGITRALVPRDNVRDLKDLPREVLSAIEVVPVDTVEDVLREALGLTLPKPESLLLAGFDGVSAGGRTARSVNATLTNPFIRRPRNRVAG